MLRKWKQTVGMCITMAIAVVCGALGFTFNAHKVKAEEAIETPALTVVANNVSYSDSVYILYAIGNSGFDRTQHQIQMLFWDEPQVDYAVGTETYAVTTNDTSTVKGQNCLIFYSDGLAAKEMTKDVFARAYVEVGGTAYYSDVTKFSVLEFVQLQKDKGTLSAEKDALFTAMLNYGAAAQVVFNYNTDRPANGTYYKITVENGTLPDGFTQGRYLMNDSVTLTAAPTPAGKYFAGWLDNETGEIVSESETLTVSVTSAKTYTATYESGTKGLVYTLNGDGVSYSVTDYEGTDTDVIIPDAYKGLSVTSIGYSVFSGCTSLTSVVIGDSVTSIGGYAFYNCTSLTSVDIPDSVTSIGDYAFAYCDLLTSVVIGESVTSIGNYAFSGCYKLVEVYNKSSLSIVAGSSDYGKVGYYAKNVYTPTSGESKLSTTDDGYILCADGDVVSLIGYIGTETDLVLPTGITEINRYAFYGCHSLTTVIIPDSVMSIGYDAFELCISLTNVEIPDSVTGIGSYAFEECTSLTSVVIGESVTSIGSSAFSGCYKLVEVYNKSSLPIVAGSEGYGCVGYYAKNIYTPTSGESKLSTTDDGYILCTDGDVISLIGYVGTETKLEIPDSVTSIRDWAFKDCDSLTSVEIPDSVTSIGVGAFEDCDSLRSVEIPDSVTGIGFYAFYSCNSLTSVVIGESVTSIGESAFYNTAYYKNASNWENDVLYIGKYLIEAKYTISGAYTIKDGTLCIASNAFDECASLTSVLIPDSVTSIGDGAFQSCASLASVEISDSVTSIGVAVFGGCASLTSVEIPDSVTSIGQAAFRNCTSLTSVVIPDLVTSIGEMAFAYCESLTSIEIPDLVTSIGDWVFYGCTSLTSVIIGNSVRSIANYAFYECTALTSITFSDTSTWYRTDDENNWQNKSGGAQTGVTNASTNATYFTDMYYDYYWYKL